VGGWADSSTVMTAALFRIASAGMVRNVAVSLMTSLIQAIVIGLIAQARTPSTAPHGKLPAETAGRVALRKTSSPSVVGRRAAAAQPARPDRRHQGARRRGRTP